MNKAQKSLLTPILLSIGLMVGFSNFVSANQKINRLIVFGDSLSDDGGNNSTWFLLKTLNGLTGEEGIRHMQPWIHNWLENRISNYTWLCSEDPSYCKTHEDRILRAFVSAVSQFGLIPVAPLEHYDNGRWSDGRMWPEYLARKMGISTANRARYRNESHAGSWSLCIGDKAMDIQALSGHAGTVIKNMINGSLIPPCLELIVDGYLQKYQIFTPDDMIVVFFGGNDYLNRYQNPETVVDAQKAIIELIIENGGKHIAWLNMPDLSKTPRYVEGGGYESQTTEVASLITMHNQILWKKWTELSNEVADDGVRLMHVDAGLIYEDIMDNASQYGFTVVDRPCSTLPVPGLEAPLSYPSNPDSLNTEDGVCSNAQQHVFWDAVHPSTATHRILARKACDYLRSQGYQCSR